MKPDFMNLPLLERENLLMGEIIYSLKKLGGAASRKEVVAELKETSTIIPENYITFSRVSEKTGNSYKPFNFQFNFAVKHLTLANFIIVPKRGNFELTEKGRSVNLESFDPEKMVRAISQPLMDENSKKKDKKTTKSQSIIVNLEEVEETKEEEWRIQLINALKKMSPKKFELFARRLVTAMGVDIDEKIGVNYVSDGGIDGYGYITSDDFRTTRVAIQAKRWEGNVSSPEIDKFRGAMDKFSAEFGIFITTSDFTREAIKTSRVGTRVITLINGEKIADLVAQYELYVTPVTTYELGKFYLEEE